MVHAGGERRRSWERGTSIALAVNAAPTPAATRRIAATAAAMGVAGLLATAVPVLSLMEILDRAPQARPASHSELAPAARFAVERPRALRGRVLNARGDPVAGATIALSTEQSGWVPVTKTDDPGQFVIDFGESSFERIKIRAEGACHEQVESAELDAASRHHLVLVLPPMAAVRGRVIDRGGSPVPRAVAKLSAGARASADTSVAGDDGRYAFSCVSPGWRRLTVWARAFRTATSSVWVDWTDVERDIPLSPSPAVRGTVVDARGQPIALARVSACEGDDEEQTISDAQGRFEMPAVTAGCSVRAHHPRFAGSHSISIPPSGDIRLRLEPGGAMAGVATDVRGRPIASFTVALTSFEPADGEPNESRVGERHDELRGSFRIDELVPGNYGVELRAEGMAPWNTTVRVSAGKVSRGLHAVLVSDESAAEPGESEEGVSGPAISVDNNDTAAEEGEVMSVAPAEE